MNTKRHLTPGNIVRLLGCDILNVQPEDHSSSTIYYCLFKDGHALAVQSPRMVWKYDFHDDRKERAREEMVQQSFELEIIQTLLNSIEFKESHWAYLIRHPDGQYRLIPWRPKTLYTIEPPLGWVPKVPESEIEIVQWLSTDYYEGFWNDKEIDVRVGWNNRDLAAIERELKARYICRNFEVTHKIYGLVERTGHIIGYMSERILGRPVEYQDRMLVYETFAKLQANNIIYDWPWGIDLGEILIHEGKVRLTTLQQDIRRISDEERRQIEATGELFNERHLRYVFDFLMKQPSPASEYRKALTWELMVLTQIPYPEHSITRADAVFEWLWRWHQETLRLQVLIEESLNPRKRRLQERRNWRKRKLDDSSDLLDSPISGALTRGARPKPRYRLSGVSALLAPESIPLLIQEFEKSTSTKSKRRGVEKKRIEI